MSGPSYSAGSCWFPGELTVTLNWNHLAPVGRAEHFTGGWDDTWFGEDFCEGPGQALIVNPRGAVKPCCGFASDLDQLTIGNIHQDSVAAIVHGARKHPYVGKVFRKGLTAIRDEILRVTQRPCLEPRRITAISAGTFYPRIWLFFLRLPAERPGETFPHQDQNLTCRSMP